MLSQKKQRGRADVGYWNNSENAEELDTGTPNEAGFIGTRAMTAPICEVEGLTIVLVGHFNPALVHPAWLARHELIRDAEAQRAEVKLIRPELSLFDVGPFQVQAEPTRFMISVVDVGQAAALRDIVQSIFTLLGETPITQFGLTRAMHFRMQDVEAWHRVGNVLAPKKCWEGLLEGAGTQSVSVRGSWAGRKSKMVQVTVEPSAKVPNGVYVAVNENFESETDGGAGGAVALMSNSWGEFLTRSRHVAESIVGLGHS